MRYERFASLIELLVACNGTCKTELDSRVAVGEITKDDAEIISFYVTIEKIKNKLDLMYNKIATV